ncbi:MAG: SDR family NAD(P)-dependent oxidoreductase, partial [Actinobacteria bacterium]|nr:SDR family NAD(P)-dependent oxidoreductase [Actinomycetota bacterium]
MEFLGRLKRRWGLPRLSPALVFEHATLEALAAWLWAEHGAALQAGATPSKSATLQATATNAAKPTSRAAAHAPRTPQSMPQPQRSAKPARRTKSRPAQSKRRVKSAPRDRRIDALERKLRQLEQRAAAPRAPARRSVRGRPLHDPSAPIAVVGYAARFPGAAAPAGFWKLLAAGRDGVGPVPAARWQLAGWPAPPPSTLQAGLLADVAGFDPLFFRLAPAEAWQMDPRQRLFLETAYHALEHAGYGGTALAGSRTGTFVGTGPSDYGGGGAPDAADPAAAHWATSGSAAILASRLAYFLDLRGPAVPVDTACSSSLVAVHWAMESLRSGACQFAVAGGVHLNLRLANFAAFQAMGALAAGGRCRSFDQRADGFVPSEGVAAVLLRPLADALAAGDTIHAVLRASAANNDGRSNGLTAPNPAAQREVLLDAWRAGDVDPRALTYLEAHGTGTALGDPIEVEAYRAACQAWDAAHGQSSPRQTCYVGSVKSNLGHAEAAAGVAGLVKLILCLEHGELVPTLHFQEPNRHITFEATPLVPLDRRRAWRSVAGQPRLAGLSAFGFGGTNVHVVVEEAPAVTANHTPEPARPELFVLSARSEAALRRLVAAHARQLSEAPAPLADLCFTLQAGRLHQRHRLAIVASSVAELRSKLALLEQWEQRFARGELGIFAGPVDSEPRTNDLDSPSAADFTALADVAGLSDAARQAALTGLARRYAQGATIDWTALHEQDTPRRRVPLPLYPFEHRRYWLDSAPAAAAPSDTSATPDDLLAAEFDKLSPRVSGRDVASSPSDTSADLANIPARDDLLWQLVWQPRPLDSFNVEQSLAGRWLVFTDNDTDAASLAALISQHGGAALSVRAGETLDPRQPHDYRRLVEEGLAADPDRSDRPLAGVLWQAGWGSGAAPRDSLAAEFTPRASSFDVGREEPLFHLAQALLPRVGELTLAVVSRGAQGATPGEPGNSALATTLALAQSLAAEGRGWRVRAIDFETTGPRDEPRTPLTASELAQLAAELTDLRGTPAGDSESPVEVVYRAGTRLARRVEPLRVADTGLASPWRDGGTYLITGGLGGIGRALAEHLARRYQVRLWLVGRRPLDVSPAHTSALEQLRARAPQVEYRAVDVADPTALAALVAEIHAAGQSLDGVIHAAGVLETDELALRTKSLAVWRQTLAAKVAGSRHLWQETSADRGQSLSAGRDWPFVLLSSIASLSPPLAAGQSDYAAANRFQRALAHELSAEPHTHDAVRARVTALVLSEWGAVGMLARHGTGPIVRRLGLLPFSAEQALAAFEQATAASDPEVLFLRGRAAPADFDPQWLLDPPRQRIAAGLAATPAATTQPRGWSAWVAGQRRQAQRELTELAPIVERCAGLPEALETLAARYAAHLFVTAGCWPLNVGALHDGARQDGPLDELAARLALVPRYRRLLPRLVEIASRLPAGVAPQLPEQHELDELVARWPLAAASGHLLSRTGPRLADVLAGRADPVGLLFDGGRFEATRAVYGESPFARFDNRLAARAVADWLATRATGLPAARVLEVGAGTGGTTAAVLPRLDPQHTQYVYTDLSAGFLNEAAERFAAHPFVEYRVFDLEREPAAQRMEGPFDVILAANVLHATTDLGQTLTRLRQLLADDGLLVLVELVDLAPWVELTFGLTDGWWRFADQQLRPHSPLLSRAAWCNLLAASGFQAAALDQATAGGDEAHSNEPRGNDIHGDEALTAGSPSGQTILAAKASTVEFLRPNEWEPPARESAGVAQAALAARTNEVVRRLFARFLRLAPDELGETTNFMDLGFDSILALQIQRALAQETGLDLPTTLLLEHASVARLSQHLVARYAQPLAARWGLAATTSTSRDESAGRAPARSASVATNVTTGEPAPRDMAAVTSGVAESIHSPTSSGVAAIAVVGVALRFPGAETPEAFW